MSLGGEIQEASKATEDVRSLESEMKEASEASETVRELCAERSQSTGRAVSAERQRRPEAWAQGQGVGCRGAEG